jgi:hypothetical protein
MIGTSRFSKICIALVVAATTLSPLAAHSADYPPVVENPEIGEPLISPVSPLNSCDVFVPLVTSENPASAKLSVAKTRGDFSPFPTLINSTSFSSVAYLAKASLVIGGVTKAKVASLPLSNISTRDCAEVQMPKNTPVRITLTKLPKSAQFTMKIGKTVIGKINSNTKGQLLLPVISITSFPKNYNLYVERSGISQKVTLRTTR